jgi:NifB/MoaA-like Fe-S oxidoreductase
MQKKYRQQIGKSFVYLADEFYLAANLSIPDTANYDDFPQLENGIGMVRNFLDDWKQCESANSEYKEPHYLDIVCGTSAEKILQPLLAKLEIPNLVIRVVPVVNRFFGSSITVTGLLIGQDILHTLQSLTGPRTGVIIPGVALRKGETIFLDDLTPDQLAEQLDTSVRIAYNAQDLRQLLSAWR